MDVAATLSCEWDTWLVYCTVGGGRNAVVWTETRNVEPREG